MAIARLQRVQTLSQIYVRLLGDIGSDELTCATTDRLKAQADVALGLLQEYGELYRHYDGQRAAYVSALTAIVGTIGAAEILGTLPATVDVNIFGDWITNPLGLASVLLGAAGFIATRKSRQRMKLFYDRISRLRSILDKMFPNLEIDYGVCLSREEVEQSGVLNRLYTAVTRAFVWDVIPAFLVFLGTWLLFALEPNLFSKVTLWLAEIVIALTYVEEVFRAIHKHFKRGSNQKCTKTALPAVSKKP